MRKWSIFFLLAMLCLLLLCACRPHTTVQQAPELRPDHVRWVHFEPEMYVLRG